MQRPNRSPATWAARHAAGTGRPSPERRGRRPLVALTAAALGATALVAVPTLAATPPLGPGNIEIMPERDMVLIDGYSAEAGETVTISARRGGDLIGHAEGVLDENGFLEVNHPGGVCWDMVTPDLKGGDEITLAFSEAPFTDSAITSTARITSVVASEAVATPEDGDIEGTVTISGTYGPDVDPSRFVVEVVNPDMREPGSLVGERAIGWSPVTDPEHPNGAPGQFSADGTFADGQFEAVFGVYQASDLALVAGGEHVAMAWMADGANDLALGATQFEFGESSGPGFPGCPAGPGGQPPVGPSEAALASPSDTSIDVSWVSPTQPADQPAITEYRVSARGGSFPQQEVALRTGGTSALLQGLEAGQAYDVFIESYNGQWGSPVAVGSVTTGGTGGGGTPTDPPTDPTEPTAPPAPVANLTATPAGLDAVDVAWSASPAGEVVTSYAVTLTDGDGADAAFATVTPPDTSTSFSGLASGTTYAVTVTATNAEGTSTESTTTVTTQTVVAPSAPVITRVLSAHEAATVEWRASTPGNAASPVTGYRIVATPAVGDPVAAELGVVTTGTITGLTNGQEYALEVFALSGSAESAPSTAAGGVQASVTPNDQISVGRVEYRDGRGEWKIVGSAQDTTDNIITAVTSDGDQIGNPVAVDPADGSFAIDIRNGPDAPDDSLIIVTSTSGGELTTGITRRR